MKKVVCGEIYKAFGFSIRSKVPLPELFAVENNRDKIDIHIELQDLSNQFDTQSNLVMNETFVMFKVQDTAIFLIEEGKRITVSPINGYKEDIIRLYLMGSCMGAILLQRGIFPLHGSAVEINGKAYGIIGDSGAGKSTLATAFLQKGFQLLTDDIIGIFFTEDKTPMVLPSYPQQKLWQKSLDQFGMNNRGFKPIYQRETKFAIPIIDQFSLKPLPLAALFELSFTENEEIELKQIEGLSRLQRLMIHTYRNFLIQSLGLSNWHFTKSIEIINQIKMYHLQRPRKTFTANELVSGILNCIKKENQNDYIKC